MLAEAQDDGALDVERRRGAQVDFRPGPESLADPLSQLGRRRLAGRDDRAVAFAVDRDPALREQHLGVEVADQILVDLGAEQVDEGKLPLLSQGALEIETMDQAGRQQHLADPLARLRLARKGPAERLAVDQAGGEKRLPDRLGLLARRPRVGSPPPRTARVGLAVSVQPKAVITVRAPRGGGPGHGRVHDSASGESALRPIGFFAAGRMW